MSHDRRTPIIDIHDLLKDYRALRPLRMERLSLESGERASIVGLDQAAAEVFVGLVTGAHLPDAGTIRVFGRSTADIADGDEWLALLDRVGIVSDRAVLLDELTVAQNLAVPFTLELEPVASDIAARVVRLAAEAGLTPDRVSLPARAASAAERARIRLARAIALDPAVILLEHASAGLEAGDVEPFGADIAALAAARGLTVLAVTADRRFASALGGPTYILHPATGRLRPTTGRTRWFAWGRAT